jgi:hypothetical protein
MSRDYRTDHNLLAVSLLAKETAINTEQTLSHTLLVDRGDVLQLKPRRESNADEMTGFEEPDSIYDLGYLSELNANFNKAKPQDFLFAYGYALGVNTPSAWGTGFTHLITGIAGSDLPGFTAIQRLGNTILKRQCASMYVDQVTSTFAKDAWAKCVASCKGTGKFATNISKESIAGFMDGTSLTLAGTTPVLGADAPTRLQNVHQIRVIVPTTLEYQEVVFSAVSAASPAVITHTAPGAGHTACTYEVFYVTTEVAWMAFPARVTEPPLRVTDLVVKHGGKWNGSAFVGGRTIDAEVDSIEHTLNNNLAVEYRVGGTGTYANYAAKGGRTQTLKLNREMREALLQQRIYDNETFGVYMKATGALFEVGKNYYVEFVFPKCALLDAPISQNGKVIAEAGDLIVLEDSTYGSVRITVANMIATVAA